MKNEITLFEKLQGEDIEHGLYLRLCGIQVILYGKMLTIALNRNNWVHVSLYKMSEEGCTGFEASLKTLCIHHMFIGNNGVSYEL